MDILAIRQRLRESLQKYRTALLVVLAGILLMALPGPGEKTPPPPAEPPAEDLGPVLSKLLSTLEGAGRVEVLLTAAAGEETVFQYDGSPDDIRTVLVSDSQRRERGLVRKKIPPRYRGAVVLCQGAGDPSVRLAVVEAVCKASGLTSDRVTVLKMK